MRDETGVAGVFGHPKASRLVARCLSMLRHRGGDMAGIVAIREDSWNTRYETDLSFLSDDPAMDALLGSVALGQVHAGAPLIDAETLWFDLADAPRLPASGRLGVGPVGVSVSGTFLNQEQLRAQLLGAGAVLQASTPAELLLNLVARSGQRTAVNRLVDAMWQIEGGYAAVMCTGNALVAVRDPYGLRPLAMGKIDGAIVVASESMALDAAGAQGIRDIEPGEMVIVDGRGEVSVRPFARRRAAPCVQEIVQLSAVGSSWAGWKVRRVRRQLGEALARERVLPEQPDVVVPVGDVSVSAAVGFARNISVPVERAMFVVPGTDAWRVDGDLVAGRRVVLVVASAGSSEFLEAAVAPLRSAGALDVHVRVASPRITQACPYGVRWLGEDRAARSEGTSTTSVAGASSIGWLSQERFDAIVAVEGGIDQSCTACMGRKMPIAVASTEDQLALFKPGQGS